MKRTHSILFAITILLQPIFYSSITVFGGDYNRIIETNIWLYVKLLLFSVILVIFMREIIGEKIPLKVLGSLYIIVMLLIITVIYQIFSFGHINSLLIQDVLIFGSRSIPTILVGILIVKRNDISNLVKFTQVVTLFVSIAVLIAFFADVYRSGNRTAFGGANYQTTAYMSALIFGMNLYYAFIHDKTESLFPLFRKEIMVFVHSGLALLLFLNAIQSGGRGGVVVCFVYVVITSIYLVEEKKFDKIFYSLLIIGVFILLLTSFLNNSDFITGFERAFSYFDSSSGTISLENSNRDLVFLNAVDYISQSPVFGYGLGSYYEIMGFYPHNILLLILFEGGILFLVAFFILILYAALKMIKLIKSNKEYRIVVYLISCNATMLMFSSTYLRDDMTWLLVGVIIGSYYYGNTQIKPIRAQKLR